MPQPVFITPLPIKRFPNKLASNVPNKIPRNDFFVILLHFRLFPEHSLPIN